MKIYNRKPPVLGIQDAIVVAIAVSLVAILLIYT